jgi:NitT/TauT family transport system substrate-binding protein
MTNPTPAAGGLTFAGKLVVFLFILACLGGAGYLFFGKSLMNKQQAWNTAIQNPVSPTGASASPGNTATPAPATFDAAEIVPAQTTTPKLPPAVAYMPTNNVVDIELSQYAGYAGLIAANNGLEPNDDSYFAKKYGFKVRIRLSEEESWPALNTGKMAASATTADVLAVYGRQFRVVVPAQIGYSRGADGLVVRSDIRRVNDLKGKTVVAAQFTESDFFIRYLAKEAGLPVNMLTDLSVPPAPDAINLVFTKTGEDAGTVFEKAVKANSPLLAGCVTWAPATTDIPANSDGKAKLLVTNKNLLIVADILIVNKGFADKNPDKVAALVDGLLMGNNVVRTQPEQVVDLLSKSLSTKSEKWDNSRTMAELQKVHLANLPENQAFFSGGITQGGSFASIYQSAVLAYGNDLIPSPVDSDYFTSLEGLKKADASGAYKDQVAAIVPLSASTGGPIENDPLLSKDIRFYFEPNSNNLDMNNKENMDSLDGIKRILDVSPGSRVNLVGHVDNSNIPNLRRQGGEDLVQKMALEAMDLSKKRAMEIRTQLINRDKVDPKRLETVGRGWTQPASATNPELNRRVEVQWFTLE